MTSKLSSGTTKTFVITVSSRALFDLEESNEVFEKEGIDAFMAYQVAREKELLKPGPAMKLVQKLLNLNNKLPEDVLPFEVILLSRNSPETALRIFDTIEAMNLPIKRYVFTNGAPTSNYIPALGTQLFLSSNPSQVVKAIESGIPAATIVTPKRNATEDRIDLDDNQIRIAFDGDSVLFNDESERAHAEGGMDGFHRHEEDNAHLPLGDGPFRALLEAIHTVQKAFPTNNCPIRTALITARGAPAHMRPIKTLRQWGVRVDEAMFLGGRPKGPFLKAFGADIFFDDSTQNIEQAMDHVPSGHVPFGVRNEKGANEANFTGGLQAVAECVPKSVQEERKKPKHR